MKENQIKLNLGCYNRKMNGFVNVDIRPDVDPDVVDNVFTLESFEDESVDLIYACHVLEHGDYKETDLALKRWNSVLKPGGILRLAVPDMEAHFAHYYYHRDLRLLHSTFWGSQKHPYDYHKNGWDFKKLKEDLGKSGFNRVRRYDWRETEHFYVDDYSQTYFPHLDKEDGKLMSLNVEAKKRPKKAPRLNPDIIKSWKDREISKLVLEYYDIWDQCEKPRGGMQQALGEVTKVKKIIGDKKFKLFVELGVCDAGSFWLYGNLFCTKDSTIIGIDESYESGAALVAQEMKNKIANDVQYAIADCNNIVDQFPENSIGLLHIDANHGYDDVKKYFENYYPKVAPGGIILIHDTNACEGSIKFRKEVLEPNYDHQLITGKWLITNPHDDPDQVLTPPGISLIRKK